MKATQLNLKMKNEIGTLARLCRHLADEGVNLLGLSAPEADGSPGVIRLLVANSEIATRALARGDYAFTAEQVIYVELKNRPGALAKTTEKLQRAAINVRHLYATAYPKAQKTAAVISVSEADFERASRLLAGH